MGSKRNWCLFGSLLHRSSWVRSTSVDHGWLDDHSDEFFFALFDASEMSVNIAEDQDVVVKIIW
ncbi:MAG: hypothetical protein IPO69_15920 [Saprospiraceae bacterium]|nr:hypothetical protein [Saprospiraceae bacterium]